MTDNGHLGAGRDGRDRHFCVLSEIAARAISQQQRQQGIL